MTRQSWSPQVLEAIGALDGFDAADALEPLWEHSLVPEERQLEAAIGNLALIEPRASIAAGLAAGAVALPCALERGGKEARDVFGDGSWSGDGEPAEVQIRRVQTWLLDPSEKHLTALRESFEPGRQLNIWHDELTPDGDAMWWWFAEVGQLLILSVERDDAWGAHPTSEYCWPSHVCAARAAVCALKAIRTSGGSIAGDAATMSEAIRAAFAG